MPMFDYIKKCKIADCFKKNIDGRVENASVVLSIIVIGVTGGVVLWLVPVLLQVFHESVTAINNGIVPDASFLKLLVLFSVVATGVFLVWAIMQAFMKRVTEYFYKAKVWTSAGVIFILASLLWAYQQVNKASNYFNAGRQSGIVGMLQNKPVDLFSFWLSAPKEIIAALLSGGIVVFIVYFMTNRTEKRRQSVRIKNFLELLSFEIYENYNIMIWFTKQDTQLYGLTASGKIDGYENVKAQMKAICATGRLFAVDAWVQYRGEIAGEVAHEDILELVRMYNYFCGVNANPETIVNDLDKSMQMIEITYGAISKKYGLLLSLENMTDFFDDYEKKRKDVHSRGQ